jgi:ribosomal protein S18 acetylase RimI-like enzyme
MATPADVDALVALVNSAYRGETSRQGWTTEADLLGGVRTDTRSLDDVIRAPGNAVLVHEEDGQIVACVHVRRTGDECYLGMLTTDPVRQGAGIGRQMIDAAERWAVDHWRSRAMHMTVLVQRGELIRWYERRGYNVTGEQRPFPYGDTRFGEPRRPDLAFYVLRKVLPAS